jgi:TPR repeat protein
MISIDAARNLAAHVTASVAGLSAVQAREQAVVTVKRHVDRAPTDRPSPAEIATAYQEAIKHQVMARDIPPTRPTAVPPPRRLDPDERRALLQRAQNLLAVGDVASARLLLERAADAQEAEAALLLARTYDTDAMGAPDARVVATDAAKARAWYRKAAEFGSLRAQQRLAQMRD